MATASETETKTAASPGGAEQAEPWTLPHMIATVRPWFDAAMYAREYRDVTGSADQLLAHFCERGWREGRNPNPDFDTLAYLRAHPDVLLHKLNPIYHYAFKGQAEARVTSPAVLPSQAALAILGSDPGDWVALLTPHVEAEFYAAALGPAADGSFDLVAHYAYRGWLDGLDPNPQFKTREVLAANTDLLRKQLNPLVHALTIARPPKPDPEPEAPALPGEPTPPPRPGPGLAPMPEPAHDASIETPRFGLAAFTDATAEIAGLRKALAEERTRLTSDPASYADADEALIAAEFDAMFYRVLNIDVVAAGIDPVTHYHRHGWQDGRNPAPWFDTRYYLATNPDVASAGVDPFLHYLTNGRTAGRLPKNPAGWRQIALAQAAEPRKATRATTAAMLPHAALVAALRDACEGDSDFVVSVEGFAASARRAEAGTVTLAVSPDEPSRLLAEPTDLALPLRLVLDGREIGLSSYVALAGALGAFVPQVTGRRTFAVLGVMGHSVGGLIAMQAALGATENLFQVDDYAAICPGYHLLRNDIVYCAAPPVSSMACRVCVYGGARPAHLAELAGLFAAVPFKVVTPSQVALDVWRRGPFGDAPAQLLQDDRRPGGPVAGANQQPRGLPGSPVRIGVFGHPGAAGGEPVWSELMNRVAGTGAYSFVHLSTPEAGLPIPGLEHGPLPYGDRATMAEAVAAGGIDLVLCLSPWPAPLSIASLAAIEGGADIVCLRESGHAAELARQYGRGVIARDEAALFGFFESLEAVAYVRRCRDAA